MKLKNENDKSKLLGVYYTPVDLAKFLVAKFVDFDRIDNVLEPSCGDGKFIDALLDYNKNKINITGIEIDNKNILSLKERYSNHSFLNLDFFEFYEKYNDKYDLIIGNPPYIRYQYLTEKQREIQSKILTKNGMKANKLINAWVAFTVACTSILTEKGMLIFVIPAELLQVAYAKDLRKFLVEQFECIDIIAFDEIIFPEIEQETVVFIGKKSSNTKGIRIFQTNNISTINNIDFENTSYNSLPKNSEKWTTLLCENEAISLVDSIKNNSNFKPFSDYAIINVGITTGNNDFFSIDKKTNQKYELMKHCVPLIGRSCFFNGCFVNSVDIEKNFSEGKKSHLLVIPEVEKKKLDKHLVRYINHGEKNKENAGYKCRIRKYWYSVPSVWVPDAFFARRNGEYPKLLINNCNAVSTDTLHRVKFKDGVDKIEVVLSYYNSISFAFTEICGRSYGGGVLEVLPSEASNIYLPAIKKMTKEKMLMILSKIDEMIRNNIEIEDVLNYSDREILINGLGLEYDYIMKFRKIWKTLQQRRLNRGKI